MSGKRVTRRLTEGKASLYRESIATRRHLTKTLAEMDKVSQQAIAILLKTATEPVSSKLAMTTTTPPPARQRANRFR